MCHSEPALPVGRLVSESLSMDYFYVYILSNRTKTLYVGVTNNLSRRMHKHKNKIINGFSKKYNLTKLV